MINRRDFLHRSLIGTSVFFIPNAVLALSDKAFVNESMPWDARKTLFTQPDLADYKFNTDGTAFFKTSVGFRLNASTEVVLPREFYMTHEQESYGAPAYYSDGKTHYVFVSELFRGYQMNGWIYEYTRNKGFTVNRIYQLENMGWHAFWGKPMDGRPTLYHYEYTGGYMRQSTPDENGVWQTRKIYNTVPSDAVALYNSQVSDPNYHSMENRFAFKYEVHRDGVYDFLELKHGWEQSIIKEKKDAEEAKEKEAPTVQCSITTAVMSRTIRNRQSLANSGCGCADDKPTASAENLCLVKTQYLKTGKAGGFGGEVVHKTTIGFHDINNTYHELPDTLYCGEDALGGKPPVLYSDGVNYIVHAQSIEKGVQHDTAYHFTAAQGWSRSTLTADDFAAPAVIAARPIVYSSGIREMKNSGPETKWINATYTSNAGSASAVASLITKISAGSRMSPPYVNPLVPIYCEGDDISLAAIKPTVIYQEVPGSKIVIPNMPAYKTQDDLGECRAFSLATLMQKYTCDAWKKDIPDCKNPPSDSAISYFGMMVYTNQATDGKGALQIGPGAESMYNVIKRISESGNKLILDSCRSFDKLVNNFSLNGKEGLAQRDKFFADLKDMYNNKRSTTEANIVDCQDCIAELNKNISLNTDMIALKKALTRPTYNTFLYSLFFDGCKMESFPVGFHISVFPADGIDTNPIEIKKKVIEGLSKGKPVLFPALCLEQAADSTCGDGHSVVISGYKKVCMQGNKNNCKDVFKVHNSWGSEWQRLNNDGWVDADSLSNNTAKVKAGDKYRIGSASVIWLE